MMKQKAQIEYSTKTANELTDVRDIQGEYLFSKSGHIFMYLRVYKYNLELLSDEERKMKTQNLATAFQADHGDFGYFALPREIDLDQYKNFLKERSQQELNHLGRRQRLAILMKQAEKLSTSGENYEHQHFIKIWKPVGRYEAETKHDLLIRALEFCDRYDSSGVKLEILKEHEIIKLCNLFANSEQAVYDTGDINSLYTPITQMDIWEK